MSPTELRIGNYVSYKRNPILNEVATVVSVSTLSISVNEGSPDGASYPKSFEDIMPIELTEDWLIKFRFKKGETEEDRNVYYGVGVAFDFSVAFKSAMVKYKNALIRDIEYVHQFQNLVHGIVGKDLDIK